MDVRITDDAVDVIRRSVQLAGLDPATHGVRLRSAGGAVRPRFAEAPEPDDVVVESGGVRVFVQREVAVAHPIVVIGVSPEHETLVVRAG